MRSNRCIVFCFILSVCLYSVLTGEESSGADVSRQMMIPHEVFVGDTAQIQYNFVSQIDFFASADESKINENKISFGNKIPDFKKQEEDCTVTDICLSRNGSVYVFSVTFVPWRTGIIDFDPVDLNELCRLYSGGTKNNLEESVPFIIDLKGIEVSSIAQKMGATSLRPAVAPILIPGTSYIIWIFAVVCVVFIIMIVVFLLKITVVVSNWKSFKASIYQRKNNRITKYRLKKLLDKSFTDEDFACQWQKIVKEYLYKKFDYNFDSCTSSKIYQTIDSLTGNTLSGKKQICIEDMCSMFRRCDYVKFAYGSIDSKLLPIEDHAAVFSETERKTFVDKMIAVIIELSSEDKKDDVDVSMEKI